MAHKKNVTKPTRKQWEEPQILAILDQVIADIQSDPDLFFFLYPITTAGLPYRTLLNWVERSESVADKYTELKQLSEFKIGSELIKNRGKLNPIATMFLLKCKYAWIEEEKARAKEVANNAITDIEIGFEDENKD